MRFRKADSTQYKVFSHHCTFFWRLRDRNWGTVTSKLYCCHDPHKSVLWEIALKKLTDFWRQVKTKGWNSYSIVVFKFLAFHHMNYCSSVKKIKSMGLFCCTGLYNMPLRLSVKQMFGQICKILGGLDTPSVQSARLLEIPLKQHFSFIRLLFLPLNVSELYFWAR